MKLNLNDMVNNSKWYLSKQTNIFFNIVFFLNIKIYNNAFHSTILILFLMKPMLITVSANNKKDIKINGWKVTDLQHKNLHSNVEHGSWGWHNKEASVKHFETKTRFKKISWRYYIQNRVLQCITLLSAQAVQFL